MEKPVQITSSQQEFLSLYPDYAPKRKPTIDERFSQWVANHPTVVGLYLDYARQVKASGRQHYSVKAISERVRWETTFVWKEDFKINNNFSAPMARLLVKLDPSLNGLFAFRKRKP